MADTSAVGSVAIVVTGWNDRDRLGSCLQHALDQDYRGPVEVVVVGDASTAGLAAWVRAHFPAVKVLEQCDGGHAAARNLGVAATRSDLVALLDSDARPERGWLSALAACLQHGPRTGGACPLVLLPDGRVHSTGIEARLAFHWAERGFGRPRAQAPADGEVDIAGRAALWRRACWDALGGLDPDFHRHHGDVDLGLRARRSGWHFRFSAAAVVHHDRPGAVQAAGAGTAWQTAPLEEQLREHDRLLVIARHFPHALLDELPRSRFYREADAAEVERALPLVLGKWSEPGLTLSLRALLASALVARRRELDVQVAETARLGRELAARQQAAASARSAYEAQIRELERCLRQARAGYEAQIARDRAERDAARAAYEAQIGELERRMLEVKQGYEAQIARDRAELDGARAAYEHEIAHRERVIAELRPTAGEASTVDRE